MVEAFLVRGGTSKGLFLNEETFPFKRGTRERDEWIRRAFGSPDPLGLQLDGIGGGITSTSKVVFVGKSREDDKHDLTYDFGN